MREKFTSKRTRFQVDKLKCKKEVIRMIIQGVSYESISKVVKNLGESCSKSGIGNYINNKLIEAKINPDGTIEVKEKEGLLTRVTKYPADVDCYDFIESRLYADNVLYKTIEK